MKTVTMVWTFANVLLAFGIIVFSTILVFTTEEKLEALTLSAVGVTLMMCSNIFLKLLKSSQ